MHLSVKNTTFLLLAALVISACSTPQEVMVAPNPSLEIRQLDTMVVAAPRNYVEEEPDEPIELPAYAPSYKRLNDLLHTRLDLQFDWEEEAVIGKASLRFQPYFYPASQLTLHAKGFEFHSITMEGIDGQLEYQYDGEELLIELGRPFQKEETYTIQIDYTAHPSASGGSSAITSDRGLFFINPRGEEPDKPQQIWTQGETENNSRWFPTIDKPNERCTQEMILTVEERFKTLSNGVLVSSTLNGDGTRTDYWKMDLPHAPYLFMLAIGEFAVVEEDWRGKPVSYYVEPDYEEDARAIFAHTPEMLSFFSEKLGVEYPWPKYSQVVVRDYVSGAMENTTGVIFGEFVQQHQRELIDNNNDRIVAHEMFHHWFGDLVTCESWSNLTLNEGFANYGEYLWFEHKYGVDAADYHLLGEWSGYFGSAMGNIHPLIYFGYEDKEDMFDAHSYNKGGSVLHMLRNYVGDAAFWAGLNKYLTENAYTAVEAHNLRLAFEAVTGEDLNWFFNQWYFQPGHPQLELSYDYDAAQGQAIVTVEQVQDASQMPGIFELPVAIEIFPAEGQPAIRHEVRVGQRVQSFTFEMPEKPRLILFDADGVLLAEKEDDKTDEELAFQFYNAPRFLHRYEAVQLLANSDSPLASKVLADALDDPFWVIRGLAVSSLGENAGEAVRVKVRQMASADSRSQVRETAFDKLLEWEDPNAVAQAKAAISNDSAYSVMGAALHYLSLYDRPAALEYAKKLEQEPVEDILLAIGEIYAESGNTDYLDFFEKNADRVNGFAAIYFMDGYRELAVAAGLETVGAVAEKLRQSALDAGQSPWRRFGATRSLNEMYKYYRNSEVDAEKEMAESLKAMIFEIRKKESNPQLQSFYDQMLPEIRP